MYETRMDEMVNDFAFRVEQQGLRLEDYLKSVSYTHLDVYKRQIPKTVMDPGR